MHVQTSGGPLRALLSSYTHAYTNTAESTPRSHLSTTPMSPPSPCLSFSPSSTVVLPYPLLIRVRVFLVSPTYSGSRNLRPRRSCNNSSVFVPVFATSPPRDIGPNSPNPPNPSRNLFKLDILISMPGFRADDKSRGQYSEYRSMRRWTPITMAIALCTRDALTFAHICT